MKVCAIVVCVIFMFSFTLNAQKVRSDVVVMKNGDRFTCEITGLKYGTLYIKLDYVDGTVEIDWSKVEKVESSRLFIVKTEDGVVHEGRITPVDPGPDNVPKINVAVDTATRLELATADVVKIDNSSERFWNRFNGDVNFGLNYTKGNNSTQYNLSSTAEYPRERWGVEATLNSTLSANEGSDTSTRNEVRTKVYRLLNRNNWFLNGGVGYLDSSEQGITRQFTFTGGLGYFFTNTNRSKISLIGGIAVQRTHYKRAGVLTGSENQVAAMLASEIRYFRFKKTGLSLYTTLLPSLNDPGRYFFKMNQNYYYKIFSNLTWNVSLYGSFDNRPPFGLPGSDYGLSSGLGWTFGNR